MTYYDEDGAIEFVDAVYRPASLLSLDPEALGTAADFDDLESACESIAWAWGGVFSQRIGAPLALLQVADELFMLAAGALPSELE